jgi:transposase
LAVAEALEREPHTIGAWVAAFSDNGPTALAFEQSGGPPPALDGGQQAQLKAVVQALPEKAGIDLANWNWKVVRRFIQERFGFSLSRSSCVNYLHRLGFVLKRPKKHFLKADEAKREAFVAVYAALLAEAQQVGAKVFFADEAHFRADADLRGKWVLKGEPALVDSTSPRWGEKASYYSAVCLETGEVEVMELEGNSNAETSAAFLRQLREKHTGPLNVLWDNAPAHHGDAMRAYLATPGLCLRLVNLPGYSPDFNADEAIWDWAREEVTANLCLGTKAAVQEKLGHFFAQLANRMEEVKQRCRTVLQARAEELLRSAQASSCRAIHVDSTLALV